MMRGLDILGADKKPLPQPPELTPGVKIGMGVGVALVVGVAGVLLWRLS